MEIKQALEETMELWCRVAECIRDSPVQGTWEEAEVFKLNVACILGYNYEGGCPCCEYDDLQAPDNQCDACPIWGALSYGCDDPIKGEWNTWINNPTPENALVIAHMAEARLDELGL